MILLTGANGFIGSSLLRRFAKRPEEIIAVDIHKEISGGDLPKGCKYLSGNINDMEFIEGLKKNFRFRCIVHYAGLLGKGEGKEEVRRLMAVNVDGTANIAGIAAAHGSRLIFPSTAMVYGDNETPFLETMPKKPLNSYAISKHLAEEIICEAAKKHGFDYAIARIAILYGPGQTGDMFIPAAVRNLISGVPFPMTEGEQERDFIHIEDMLDLFEIFLERSEVRGIYNAGTGKPITLRNAVLLIREACGTDTLPMFGAVPYRNNESWRYSVDPSLAWNVFGWSPSIRFEDGIKSVVNFYQKGLLK